MGEMVPSALAQQMMTFLDCPCTYFSPVKDDEILQKAYKKALQQGKETGFTPVLVKVDDILFDRKEDPQESVNRIGEQPELARKMRKLLRERCAPVEKIRERAEKFNENLKILGRCDYDDETERWHAPESARYYPDPMVSSRLTRTH